jgi:hypothetical protein
MRCGGEKPQRVTASSCPWSPQSPWIPVRSASIAHRAPAMGRGFVYAMPHFGDFHHECRRAG